MNPHIINRNHAELKRLLAILFVTIGLADTTTDALAANDTVARAMRALGDPATISRRVHRMILALLVPVESATRRLIIYMAAALPTPALTRAQLKGGVQMWPLPTRALILPCEAGGPKDGQDKWLALAGDHATRGGGGDVSSTLATTGDRTVHPPPFRLVDPRPRWFWETGAAAPFPGIAVDPTSAFVQVSDAGLMRRVAALAVALEDMDAQARRYANWRARSAAHLTRHGRALRLGSPPGAPSPRLPRAQHRPEHHCLAETDNLARFALSQRPPVADTS